MSADKHAAPEVEATARAKGLTTSTRLAAAAEIALWTKSGKSADLIRIVLA